MIRVQVHGDSFLDLADEITDETLPVALAAADTAADMLLAETQRLLRLRSGPEPAPAGAPPAEQTGALVKSFRKIPARARGRVITSGIRSPDKGANRLEFGKVDSRGIITKAHPYVRPAMDNTDGAITAHLESAL